MTNGPPPFWPPLEPEQLEDVTRAAAVRLAKLERVVFDQMTKIVSGFWEMPPRRQFAFYLDCERRMQAKGLTFIDLLFALESVDGVEAARHAKNYAKLQFEYAKRNGNRRQPVTNGATAGY